MMTEKRQGMRGCAHIGDDDFDILPMVMVMVMMVMEVVMVMVQLTCN